MSANCQQYDTIHNFSVWQRTGSYPVDLIRFKSYNEKPFQCFFKRSSIFFLTLSENLTVYFLIFIRL